MCDKVLNIFGKYNQIELITSEGRSTYAKCKILENMILFSRY